MTSFPQLAVSILDADFAHLGDAVRSVAAAGADRLHLDVMDGHYVPNLSFGLPVVRSLRTVTSMPFDAHLMVLNPEPLFAPLASAGCQNILIHPDAVIDVSSAVTQIHALGMGAGLAFAPDMPVDILTGFLPQLDQVLLLTVAPGFGGQPAQNLDDKIRAARAVLNTASRPIALTVDGGITPENARHLIALGADILVVGSYIFKQGAAQIPHTTRTLKDLIHAA